MNRASRVAASLLVTFYLLNAAALPNRLVTPPNTTTLDGIAVNAMVAAYRAAFASGTNAPFLMLSYTLNLRCVDDRFLIQLVPVQDDGHHEIERQVPSALVTSTPAVCRQSTILPGSVAGEIIVVMLAAESDNRIPTQIRSRISAGDYSLDVNLFRKASTDREFRLI